MSIAQYPTVEYVRECLREENGHLFWTKRPISHFPHENACNAWNGRFSGKEAGCHHQDRNIVIITFKQAVIPRYHIVWALHNGAWPDLIDHWNNDSTDDRIENLRSCTHAQNAANRRIDRRNKSGYKGVWWDNKFQKWIAQTSVNKKRMYIGSFPTAEEAHDAYVEFAKQRFGEFANDGTQPIMGSTSSCNSPNNNSC
jgi:hypothetical protein